MKIKRISGNRFTWEKFACRQGISQLEVFTSDFTMLTGNGTVLGWCYARELPVRPRLDGVAIMVEMDYDGEIVEAWLHAPDHFGAEYCEGFNAQESESIGGPCMPKTKEAEEYLKNNR